MPEDRFQANDLLAAAIHEIKNRFGLLNIQLDELLASLPLDSNHQHSANRIKSEAQFISSELVRVLASYKTLGAQASANIDQQFLVDFLEEKVARHAITARAGNLTIRFDCDEDLNGFFDAGILSILLDTAIYNAVKEQATEILLHAEEQNNQLVISVHDNGPGFPAAMLEQPLTQGAIKADSQSTGLGLHFAQRLLALHQEGNRQGHLSLGKSPLLGGACVNFHLPQ